MDKYVIIISLKPCKGVIFFIFLHILHIRRTGTEHDVLKTSERAAVS